MIFFFGAYATLMIGLECVDATGNELVETPQKVEMPNSRADSCKAENICTSVVKLLISNSSLCPSVFGIAQD